MDLKAGNFKAFEDLSGIDAVGFGFEVLVGVDGGGFVEVGEAGDGWFDLENQRKMAHLPIRSSNAIPFFFFES